jgi:hypothetical protein
MKKYIRCAEESIEDAFDELIESANKAGYKMTVSGDTPKVLLVSSDRDLPRITVTTIDIGSERYQFQAKLMFPDIDTEALEYYDGLSYIIEDRWAEVGKFITKLRRFTYYK